MGVSDGKWGGEGVKMEREKKRSGPPKGQFTPPFFKILKIPWTWLSGSDG